MKLFLPLLLLCMMATLALAQAPSDSAVSAKSASVFLAKPLTPGPIGATLVAPVWLTSQNGDVNAFSWSVTFDPAVLSYVGYFVVDSGATIIANEQQVGTGKVGYLFGKPSAGVFPVGTTLCYLVYFKMLKVALPEIGIGNQPIAREVDDAASKIIDADFAVIAPPTAEFFAGPYWSFGQDVTIGIAWSSYPAAVWRIDHDGTRKRVDQCIILPNNSRKCTDTPKGGGRVYYYLEWDVGVGKLQSGAVEVRR